MWGFLFGGGRGGEGMSDGHLLQLASDRAGWGGELDLWGYRT